jgi:hypothetical protein
MSQGKAEIIRRSNALSDEGDELVRCIAAAVTCEAGVAPFGEDLALQCAVSTWARLDSNQRPTDYESAALTN